MENMKQAKRPRLIEAQVTGLFGEYDHHVRMTEFTDFSIIYGPNGVGKTKFLECLEHLSACDTEKLTTVEFERIKITYSDGAELSASRKTAREVNDDPDDSSLDGLKRSVHLPKTGTNIRRISDNSELVEYMEKLGIEFIEIVLEDGERPTTKFTQPILVGVELDTSETEFRAWELLSDRDDIRRQIRRLAMPRRNRAMMKNRIKRKYPMRLIDTHRLVEYRKSPEGERTTKQKIVQISQKIKDKLDEDMSNNSRLTQKLDSSFPHRVLGVNQVDGENSRGGIAVSQEEVLQRISLQDERRRRIAEILPLELEVDIPASSIGELADWQVKMLDLYLRDTERKLDSFSESVSRIDTFESIVNSRLVGKHLRVNLEDGLTITKNGSGKKIELETLSSGEQHELVLFFDLLFDFVGGVVLIDEPEISLHIGWQRKFIDDVKEVAALNNFQFVIATHSPQIIGKYWSRTNRLGPDPDSNESDWG